jgi:glycosyltransferase involved in cell wall biosynthesis
MAHPALSVVVCTYEGAAYLKEQLDSLLCQTRKPDEIVVADDCSTDATWSILEAFEKKAGLLGIRVSLFCNGHNVGFVENFTAALRRASGDLLFLCDQDDVWHWDKLNVVAKRFEADPRLTLLFTDARLVNGEGEALRHSLFDALELKPGERKALLEGKAFDVLLRRSVVTGATAAFRRGLLDSGLPIGEGWIHDEWLAVIAAATGRVGMVEDALIDYRQHGGNQIGMRRRTWADKWSDMVRPREAQFEAEVRRLESLAARLSSLGGLEPSVLQVKQKREHFERRLGLGRRPPWRRLAGIAREAAQGDYRRYGTGSRSMLRDLFRRG